MDPSLPDDGFGCYLHSPYSLGEIVYLITDSERKKRIITGINFRTSIPGQVTYCAYQLNCGASDSWHSSIEFSRECPPEFEFPTETPDD